MSMLHYIYDCLLNEFDMRLKILTHLHILDQMYALLSLSVSSQINGEPYWYYEYLIRKSPTTLVSISSWCIFSSCSFMDNFSVRDCDYFTLDL